MVEGKEVNLSDDGISQQVTVNQGVSSLKVEEVNPYLKLITYPYGVYIVNKYFIFEEPTQRCPVCKNKVHSTEVYVKIKATEN